MSAPAPKQVEAFSTGVTCVLKSARAELNARGSSSAGEASAADRRTSTIDAFRELAASLRIENPYEARAPQAVPRPNAQHADAQQSGAQAGATPKDAHAGAPGKHDPPAGASTPHIATEPRDVTALAAESLALAFSIIRRAAREPDAVSPYAAWTMVRSVVRPLSIALVASGDGDVAHLASTLDTESATGAADVDDDLLRLALTLGAYDGADLDVLEAAAAMSRLIPAAFTAMPGVWLEHARHIASREPSVYVAWNGPYVAIGGATATDHLGVNLEPAGPFAFCRCGQSASKPYCDGSHAVSGFTGAKDAHRVADRLQSYAGQQLTVLDNRGICAHSAFCTDRLSAVFRAGQEPFVTPSGARADDILRAVRRCPSGALGVAIGGTDMRELVDRAREPGIEVSKNGPYRLTGGIPVFDERGALVPRAEGASLKHCSLCRCGSSLNKPFCSGMHWTTGFTDPAPSDEPTLFEWAGGYPALLDTTIVFYGRYVPADPLVGPLFATMAPDHPERVASWLSEVMGGPKFYSERYGGYTRMISQHLDKHLTEEQRSHWARLMAQSADEAGLPRDPEFRAAFIAYIEWGSRIAVENSASGAKPPEGMPVPRWWWVCDATPGSRPSASGDDASAEAAPLVMPAEGEPPSFEKHVKPLFRQKDRASMKFAFDLWSAADVSKHADDILARVRAGTMPCDGAWESERVELFARWVEAGKPS